MISAESIKKLKSQIDIVNIVEHYIPLKKSGRNFVCICPFHNDKTPSMSVSSDMEIFHCFACKAGGDAIKFVMEYEKISYPEALEKIASMMNFTLEYTANNSIERKIDKQILENLNAYYQSLLFKNTIAVNYLHSRGIDNELIMSFGLGYAPHSDNTIRFLENEKIPPQEAIDLGIVKQGEGECYASFIDRITFPIRNHMGKIVGFGGRTITNHPAKYVNSPQSLVFDKSSILYAFDIVKKRANEKKELIITEGYMDTIMLHKAGFTNAVAVLGTALTEKHVPLIARGGYKVILSFDGDSAGINAAIKSAKLLSIHNIDSNVVVIENGLDPADMVFNGEISRLKKMYASGMESGEFLIRHIAGEFDINRPQLKQKALEEIQKYTFLLKPIVANSYKKIVSNILQIDIDSFELSKNQTTFTNKKRVEKQTRTQKQKDYLELSVLKFFLNNKDFFSKNLKSFPKELFKTHQFIYEIMLKDYLTEEDSSLLREVLLDSSIDEIKDSAYLRKSINILKDRFFDERIEYYKHSTDENKFSKIKEFQDKKNKLRLQK